MAYLGPFARRTILALALHHAFYEQCLGLFGIAAGSTSSYPSPAQDAFEER
jgi:hypothetical protein